MSIDILFITPNSSKKVYQDLSKDYSAIEPPTWSLLLAQSCRAKNYKVNILDSNAERLDDEESFNRIKNLNPRLICFVVYGQNVNAGTTNMVGAIQLANYIKQNNYSSPIIFIGSHIQALPLKTLNEEPSIDIVCTNEGVYSLHNILKIKSFSADELQNVNGIGLYKI